MINQRTWVCTVFRPNDLPTDDGGQQLTKQNPPRGVWHLQWRQNIGTRRSPASTGLVSPRDRRQPPGRHFTLWPPSRWFFHTPILLQLEGSTQHTQQNKNGKSQSVSPSFQGRTISNPLACLLPGKPWRFDIVTSKSEAPSASRSGRICGTVPALPSGTSQHQ